MGWPAALDAPSLRARDVRGPRGAFKLDTGAGGSLVIHQSTVERLGLGDGDRPTTPVRLGGVGGFVEAKGGEIAHFEIAGKRLENVRTAFQTEKKGANADPYTDGNIGAGVIGEFTLIIDYGGDHIALVEKR